MIRLPNLTRLNRRKGIVHPDLKIDSALRGVNTRIGARYRINPYSQPGAYRYRVLLEKLVLSHFDVDDASYRVNFLSELLEPDFRRAFDAAYAGLPHGRALPVREQGFEESERAFERSLVEDESDEPNRSYLERVKRDIAVIRKYVFFADTLEALSELSGASEACHDLTSFASRARKSLPDFARAAEPLKKKISACTSGSPVDIACANACLDKIGRWKYKIEDLLFGGPLEESSAGVRKQLYYYLTLCIPYELTMDGERIPSCKPTFLDSDRREGTITDAYHPNYWEYREERVGRRKHLSVTDLNIPNDIHWGDDARNTFIQGPNSMGKSVYLLTVALNVHLAMAGLRPFASSCEMSPVGQIFPCFDLGDSEGAGHFETGTAKLEYMLKNISREDMCLLDEAGKGTEPEAELRIAKGLSDAFIYEKGTSFVVTHDRSASQPYRNREGVCFLRTANLGDEERKYKVWPGFPRGGYAMQLAREKGIDPQSVRQRLRERFRSA